MSPSPVRLAYDCPVSCFPIGQYLVSDIISLRHDTVLIGLRSDHTRSFLADSTPTFQGDGEAKSLLEVSQGGTLAEPTAGPSIS